MSQHMAMDQPFARVVEHTQNVPLLLALQKGCVPVVTERATGAKLVKVMPVQMNSMREIRVVL